MPTFSVIVPVYNVAPWLRECLDSIAAQAFSDWECVCVDDGSTDESGKILDEYSAIDPRFRVIHQTNVGVGAARNVALDNAQGEWICFLDADDKVGIQWLHDIAEGAALHPEVDWIRTSYRDWHEGKKPIPWPEGDAHRLTERVHDAVNHSVWRILTLSTMMTVNVIRRAKLASVRFSTEIKYCEDGCFILDFVFYSKTKTMLTIPNEDYLYRMRSSSASHSMTFQGLHDTLEALRTRWERCPGDRGVFSPAVDRFIFRCYRASHSISYQDSRQLRQFLWKAWRSGFFSPFRFRGRKPFRWLLFLLFGNPRLLFGKPTWTWLVPIRRKKSRVSGSATPSAPV